MSISDKTIIGHIKKLSQVAPDESWKQKNRELLYNQISSTINDNVLTAFTFGDFFRKNIFFQYILTIPQSSLVAVFIFAFLASGSIFGLRASENSLPGDSLYIAKIVSEKTQQAFTFDDKDKAILSLEFAGKRAKEIDQVLAGVDVSKKNSEQVEKLVSDFKKEIGQAKIRLEKISKAKEQEKIDDQQNANTTKSAEVVATAETDDVKNNTESESEEVVGVFTANNEKDGQGIEVSGPDASESDKIEAGQGGAAKDIRETDPQEILKKAGDSLVGNDISSTLILMDEADEAIGKVGTATAEEKKEEQAIASTTKD